MDVLDIKSSFFRRLISKIISDKINEKTGNKVFVNVGNIHVDFDENKSLNASGNVSVRLTAEDAKKLILKSIEEELEP